MSHLTVDEIISFVSLTELNREALELSAAVNRHICECKKCFELVNNFQTVYDEFSRMSNKIGFADYLNDACKNEINNKKETQEAAGELEDSL